MCVCVSSLCDGELVREENERERERKVEGESV